MYSPTHHVLRRGEAQVLTIHDLIALRFPLQHKVQYLYFRHVLPRELARCRAVFTVSETTRQDIHDTYRVPLDRIRVVPNGVDRTLFRPDALGATRGGAGEPYLLVVGASFAHKNIEELLAHAHCWRERYRLVIVSSRGHYRQVLEQAVTSARLCDRVRFIDYAAQADLIRLYQRCAAFVYPSRWEGFGIPPLEAMACGAPVIVSDIPAHREVLGDHATFVRLGDAADWERAFSALERASEKPIAQGSLGHHATSPLDRFTWERSAERLVEHLLETEPRLHQRARQPLAAHVA
jgi:glycosyltransferase involved in cell wall biosynthesis